MFKWRQIWQNLDFLSFFFPFIFDLVSFFLFFVCFCFRFLSFSFFVLDSNVAKSTNCKNPRVVFFFFFPFVFFFCFFELFSIFFKYFGIAKTIFNLYCFFPFFSKENSIFFPNLKHIVIWFRHCRCDCHSHVCDPGRTCCNKLN